MRKWFRQWLFKEDDRYEETIRPAANAIRDTPSIQAFKIDNGYIVRVHSDAPFNTMRTPTMAYCKDHQAIADYIVSQAAISKLAGNAQMELPLTGGSITNVPIAKVFR
jgi:hypothetical protein